MLPHWASWLGILTGSLGLVSEALRFVAPALYAVYGPLLWVWFAVVGISLLRLSRGIVPAARSFNRRHLQASREQRTA
ncbi:MAG: hypothetical protein NVS2B15_16260 [Pseudarthrobacter sp.]